MANIAAIPPASSSAPLAPLPALQAPDDDFDSLLASYTPLQTSQHVSGREAAPPSDVAAAPVTAMKIVQGKAPKDSNRVERALSAPAPQASRKASAEPDAVQKSEPAAKPAAPSSNSAVTQQVNAPTPQATPVALGAAPAGEDPDDAAPVLDAHALPAQAPARQTANAMPDAAAPSPDPALRAQPQQNAPAQVAPAKGAALPAHVVNEIVAAAKGQTEQVAAPTPATAAAPTTAAAPRNIAAMITAARAAISLITTSKPDSKPDAKPAARARPDTGIDAATPAKEDSARDARPDTALGVKIAVRVDTARDAKPGAELGAKVAANVAPGSDAPLDIKLDAGPGTKVAANVDPRSDTPLDIKLDAGLGTRVAANADPKPDAQVDAKPDAKLANPQPSNATAPEKSAPSSTDASVAQRDAAAKNADDQTGADQTQKPQAAAPEKGAQPAAVREPVVQAQPQPGASVTPITAGIAPSAGTSAAPMPASAAPQTPAPAADADVQPNVGALAAAIAAKSATGSKTFEIRLDPPEMGRVDVHLTVDNDGKAHALLMADRPQTLELLQRDSQNLERALKDAGLNLSNNSLNFSLKGEGRQGDGGGASMARTRSLTSAVVARAEAANASEINFGSASGRLDIRV